MAIVSGRGAVVGPEGLDGILGVERLVEVLGPQDQWRRVGVGDLGGEGIEQLCAERIPRRQRLRRVAVEAQRLIDLKRGRRRIQLAREPGLDTDECCGLTNGAEVMPSRPAGAVDHQFVSVDPHPTLVSE